MRARDIDAEDIDVVVEQLKSEGLQCDSRYTEALVHDRVNRGYGPRHIARELKQKGIGKEVIEEFIDERDPYWLDRIEKVRDLKFGEGAPDEYREQARQSRFLQYRGFSGDQIHRLFKRQKGHDD